MRTKIAVSLIFVALSFTALAAAQNQPDAATKEPTFFAKIAIDVAGNVQKSDLNGYLAVYVDQRTWAAAVNDSDLGPFAKLKEAKAGRSMACLFAATKDAAVCVFFDDDSPFGVTAVRATGGKIDVSSISAAYQPVTKEMLKPSGDFRLTPGEIASDDGTQLVAYQVASIGKAKNE